MQTELNAREDDLLRRAVQGDEQAFLLIYRAHQATLYRYALRMTGRTWAAEELVQEVFLTLFRESARFDPVRGPLGAFLFGIVRNHVRKHLDRSPAEVPLDDGGELPAAANPVAQAKLSPLANPAGWTEHRQKFAQLERAMLEIPEEFREAIVLCDLEELSYEEAAKLLNCPIGTVRSRLHRGRALLMARMEFLREQPRKAVAR